MNQNFDHNSKDEPEPKKAEKRKNKSSKNSKNVDDNGKITQMEKPSAIDPNIIHYANKLEYQLISTREKIKSERNKFQHIISGLGNYLEENDGTSQMLKNYLKQFDSGTLHEPPSTSNFEKLFTTSKYVIQEETTESGKTATKNPKKITSKISDTPKELFGEEDQKPASSRKTKQKSESTSKPKPKKQKPSKTEIKDDNSDDVEIMEVPPPISGQFQIPTLDPVGNLLQNQNLSAEQLSALLNQQTDPNDLLQSYLMLQATNPSLLAGIQGFDVNQYEKLAQEMLKMGGNPQQYYK